MWMLVHWLLPAKATKEDARDLLFKAQKQWETGLELYQRNDW
jgi:hypothetical protein